VQEDNNHHAKRASLTKNKGKLTITTQQGSIHADQDKGKAVKAKNIYLIDNPLAADQDFEVTLCLSGFTPKQSYQQAALICYDDDDNYIKWSYEYNWQKGSGTGLILVRETGAKVEHDRAETPKGKKLWLRLTRRGGDYEYSSSGDGKKFTVHGEKAWGTKGPARIGLLAKNGGVAGVPEVDVCFELFELRSPPPPKKD
jgi:regulation of enolase protein 1 (concanavalin A-like superfamily)